MKYNKGKKIIEASEKAYNLIYKNKGYKQYKSTNDISATESIDETEEK